MNAVLLTFDLDGEYVWEELYPGVPYWITQGEYGPKVGVYRILDLLEAEGITATFCVVGLTAEKYPEAVQAIAGRGHEVAVHGFTHKGYNELTPELEREGITRTRGILRELTGLEPVGHRTPRWRPSPSTRRILDGLGFQWNSDHMGSERPYYNVIDGEESGLLEIPVSYILDDWNYYYDWGTPPSDVLTVWKVEYDSRYRNGVPFCLTMHPQVTGRPSRLIILEEFIEYARSKEAEFMTMGNYTKLHGA